MTCYFFLNVKEEEEEEEEEFFSDEDGPKSKKSRTDEKVLKQQEKIGHMYLILPHPSTMHMMWVRTCTCILYILLAACTRQKILQYILYLVKVLLLP